MSDPKRILVVRRDNIGDLVCTTPMLSALRKAYPDAWIGVLVNAYNVAVVRGNPDIDEIFAYRKAKHRMPGESRLSIWLETARLLLRLRQKKVDLALVASPGGERYAKAAGAKRIISGKGKGHEVTAVGDLLKPLGIPVFLGPLKIISNQSCVDALKPLVEKLHGRRLWAIHISARELPRRWPAAKFIELIKMLTSEDRGFILFWSPGKEDHPAHPGDDEKAETIMQACRGLPVTAMPTNHLDELIAGLSLCDGFVGSDGGAMHVAAALQLKIVALFENSDYKRERWAPWQVRHQLLQPTSYNVADIPENAVAAALCHLDEEMKA